VINPEENHVDKSGNGGEQPAEDENPWTLPEEVLLFPVR
jgi:hypothetical protein